MRLCHSQLLELLVTTFSHTSLEHVCKLPRQQYYAKSFRYNSLVSILVASTGISALPQLILITIIVEIIVQMKKCMVRHLSILNMRNQYLYRLKLQQQVILSQTVKFNNSQIPNNFKEIIYYQKLYSCKTSQLASEKASCFFDSISTTYYTIFHTVTLKQQISVYTPYILSCIPSSFTALRFRCFIADMYRTRWKADISSNEMTPSLNSYKSFNRPLRTRKTTVSV